MTVSIIIPTFNRNRILCRTISNIMSFDHQFIELIIVDQTKDHDLETTEYINALKSRKNVLYIFVEYPNLPNARNTGIKYAKGDVIIFFDDDVEISDNTISEHISFFNKPEIACITGSVKIMNINKSGNQVLENTSKIKNTLKNILFFFLRKKASYVGRLGIIANFSGKKVKPADTSIGCNMSFRKEIFEKCGYFDVNYTGNAVREDTDFCYRLRKNGYKIIYNPKASIVHFMENSGGTRTEKNINYWYSIFKNQSYFYIKNFNFFFLHIFLLQIFDLMRCLKVKSNPFSLFIKSYNEAKSIVNANQIV